MEHLVSLLRKNKLLAAALVAELAVVVWLAAGLFGPAYRLSLTPDAFPTAFPALRHLLKTAAPCRSTTTTASPPTRRSPSPQRG